MRENPKFRGVLLDENNNPIPGTEFEAWHSRSVAVTVIITDKSHSQFFFEKRGPGCPDEVGKLCLPCGYVAWDETTKGAAVREVFEETGLTISVDEMRLIGVNDDPMENRQNITLRYLVELPDDEFVERISQAQNSDSATRGGENNEVDGLYVLSVADIMMRADSAFAFSHKNVIKSIIF